MKHNKHSVFSYEPDPLTGGSSARIETEAWLGLDYSDKSENAHSFACQKQLWMGLTLVAIAIMLLFGGRLFSLQVVHGDRYQGLANGNRVREFIEYAERGTIYDRDGEVIAENTAGYQVRIIPEQLPDSDTDRQSVYEQLEAYTKLNATTIKKRAEAEGLDYVLPIALPAIVDQHEALRLQLVVDNLSGVEVDHIPLRDYNARYGLGNIVGYISLATAGDLEARDDLALIDYVGRSGIEQQYDHVLRGDNGFRRYEVDATGKPIRLIASQPATPGKDIYLSLDLDLQATVAKEVKAQADTAPSGRGSGIVIHPMNGQVLAMVTYPWYDNNAFVGGISSKDYGRLANNPNQPLYNKVTAGGYPSGSIIKPLVAAAALEEGVVDENTIIHDRGYIEVVSQYSPGASFRFDGWNPAGLGPMNVRRAIAMSSNIYFYTVGGGYQGQEGLGVERLTHYYKQFGLGEPTGIDLPNETTGRVPTPEWKKEYSGESWFIGDTYNISIGQGDLLISPLQITTANNTIVNGGKLLRPQLLHHIEGQQPVTPDVRRQVEISDSNLQIVREGMHEVTYNGATGAWRFANVPVPFAGKSGTAETKATTDGEKPTHGWFTAYAPYDNPEVMMTIMIEQGGSGSSSAAPAVANVLESYFTPSKTTVNLSP